jgi:hypothetical protein
MPFLMTTLALALPVLLGSLLLNLLVPARTAARAALVLGNGTLIGLLLIPQILRGLHALGAPLAFLPTALLAGALITAAAVAHLARAHRTELTPSPAPAGSPMPTSHRVLFLFIAAMIIARVATLGLEILWRPLFPWDATMHWATKAKVWFELGWMAPFVENHVWLNMGGEGVYTDRHAGYPATIPLLQVWMNLATGYWDENLMNLPWLLCFVALGGAFYGQLRAAGVGALTSLAFTYLLLSMPLLNIHVALAGYADLFLGAAYCAGLMAFHNWLTTRRRWQGALTLYFALACLVIKNEGAVWVMTFLPALALSVRTRHKVAKLLLLFVLTLVLFAILAHKNPVLLSYALTHITELHLSGFAGIIQAIWLHDNWHLIGYLFAAVIPLGLLLPGAYTQRYAGLVVALSCALGLFLFIFLFTAFGEGASNFTGVGRLCLHLFPGLLFLCALISNELLLRDRAADSKFEPLAQKM